MKSCGLRRRALATSALTPAFLLAITLATPFSAPSGAALAAEFIISTPVTSTNGGFVIDGDDRITVTGTGAITTDGTGEPGITTLSSGNNIITNEGLIVTSGWSSPGIFAWDGNTVTNSGGITTTGDYGRSIEVNNGNLVTNSGTITATGDDSYGIHAWEDNIIVNDGTIVASGGVSDPNRGRGGIFAGERNRITNSESGSISTTSVNGHAIYGVNDSVIVNNGRIWTSGDGATGLRSMMGGTITNSGSVTTTGYDADGIFAWRSSTVTNSGTISTTGDDGAGIYANDVNTITNGGTITTSGDFARGIDANSDNTITNSGTITTSGNYADAIEANSANTITNSGTITTFGNAATGIEAEDDNTINNSGTITTFNFAGHGIEVISGNFVINGGTITTSGLSAKGISADNDNTITNSGSITTSGDEAAGLEADDYNTVANSGTIITRGSDSTGLEVDNRNQVANSGTITTFGEDAHGLKAYDDNVLTNSGSIVVWGEGSIGVQADDDNVIVHSGRVVSARGKSFELDDDNTLYLVAPAFIGGEIDLGDDTRVNITTGPSHSILWELSEGSMDNGAPSIDGTVPWFYNPTTEQIATFDPTGLAAQADALADLGGDVSGLIAGRFARAVAEGSADGAAVTGAWVSGFAGRASHDGNAGTLDRDVTTSGVAIGLDGALSETVTLGLLAGWGWSAIDASSRWSAAQDVEANGFFAALYGRAGGDGLFVDAALMGGSQDHDSRRFVNDNLAPMGESFAEASYGSWWIAPQAGIGYSMAAPAGWTLTPYASARWSFQALDGYSETGTNANATVAGRDVSVLETRMQLSGERQTVIGLLGLRAGWQWRSQDGDAATVTMIDQTVSVPAFGQDRHAGFVGGSLDVAISDSAALELDAEGTFGDGTTAGRIGARFALGF